MKELLDKTTAELIGKITLYERVIAELARRLDEQESRIKELERHALARLDPAGLISEARAAKLLGLSTQTLARWRKSRRPPIPVLEKEGVIRYRVADIEKFIQERTRGARASWKYEI